MNPIAKIIVTISGAERDRATLLTAFEVARLFHAHVEVLLARPAALSVPAVGVPFSVDAVQIILGREEEYASAVAVRGRELVTKICSEQAVQVTKTPCVMQSVTCSIRSDSGTLPEALPYRARLSDLVVFPPLRLPGFVDIQEAFLKVLTDVGRPVLVSIEKPLDHIARSIAIGWDGSRSAARAVSVALPFLSRAEYVDVIEVRHAQSRPRDDEIERYLRLHGVSFTRHPVHLNAPSVGDMLAATAAARGADLLVIGGYGHSHLREAYFGGVTSDVLARARMPVFLAH